MNEMHFDDEEWEDMFPEGYFDVIERLKSLLLLLYPGRKHNDVQFLVMLSDDINLFRIYMEMANIKKSIDACRYLFMAFPEAVQSKNIKNRFGRNMIYKKSRIDASMKR